MPGVVWSGAVLTAERLHVAALFLWAAASVLFGGAVLVLLARHRAAAALLRAFALQALAWGALEALGASLWWHALGNRDATSFAQFTALLLNAAWVLAACTIAGVTLVVGGRVLARRPAVSGSGLGILVQALVLLALDASLVGQLVALGG